MEDIQYKTILSLSNVAIGYREKRYSTIINNHLNAQIKRGEMICLLGPNGCGKSTLIRTLAGMQPALDGKIFVDDEDISSMNLEKLAKKISVVLTDSITVPNLTVRDIVSLGRFPHTNWFGKSSKEDDSIVTESIEKVHLEQLAEKEFLCLSDGEKQRTLIAKALAQDTPLVILDEPTAHLDLPNRIAVMQLLQNLAHTTKKSILLSTHELDLATQFADSIWLIQRNQPLIIGNPEDLRTNKVFERAFNLSEKYFY